MDESSSAFVARWTAELRALQATVAGSSLSSTDLATASASVQFLSQQLTEAAERIPVYELGRCERELKTVLESLNASKTKSAPKPKFSFKRTATPSSSSYSTPAPAPPPPPPSSTPPPSRAPPPIPPTSLTLTSLTSHYLTSSSLPSSSTSPSPSPLLLSNLSHSFIDLLSSPVSFSALYLYSLKNCIVLIEPIEGSIMLHGCEECTFVLGGHQFRMHDSKDCKIFLQTGSTPIIERCTNLVFGAYPPSLSTKSLSPSSFANVQDFDAPFATSESPSPNFRVATEEEGREWEGEKWGSVERRKKGWNGLVDGAGSGGKTV